MHGLQLPQHDAEDRAGLERSNGLVLVLGPDVARGRDHVHHLGSSFRAPHLVVSGTSTGGFHFLRVTEIEADEGRGEEKIVACEGVEIPFHMTETLSRSRFEMQCCLVAQKLHRGIHTRSPGVGVPCVFSSFVQKPSVQHTLTFIVENRYVEAHH